MRKVTTIGAAVIGLLLSPPWAGAAEPAAPVERATVQVRLYDSAEVSAAEQLVAQRVAAGVLSVAGIDIRWLVCGEADAPGNAAECGSPLADDELAVRLVRLPGRPTARGTLSLGYSLIDSRIAAGSLATVYVDRVQWLASQGRRDMTMVLGLAIAHEIGHLLRGTQSHAETGLMRPVWSHRDFERGDAADWLFTAADIAAMRQAIQARHLRNANMVTWSIEP